MKHVTSLLLISLILLLSCHSGVNENATDTRHVEMNEQELTRVSMLINPAPKTYQEDQINKLIQYALNHNWPVHKTKSGLLYWIEVKGNDERVQKGDEVLVRYEGDLLNGKVFDRSPPSGEPVRFKVQGVIPAWQEALFMIGEGGKIKVLAHSDLGYGGQRIVNVIPPYSPLIFEIELIAIVGH